MARSTPKGKKKQRENGSTAIQLELTPEELEVVLKACRKYRQTIPIYLESRKGEVRDIDSVLRQLVKKRKKPE